MRSNGVQTNRDVWVYNFSKKGLEDNVLRMIDFYNSHVDSFSAKCQEEGKNAEKKAQELIDTCDVKSRLQELFCRKNPLFSQWSPPTHAGGVIARYEAVGNVPAGNRKTTRERSLNLVATTGEGQGLDGTRSTQVNRRKHRYV